jgi:hypothetical protein
MEEVRKQPRLSPSRAALTVVSLWQAEVASKSKRVVELEQRVHADQYDIDAWTDLLRLASGIDAVSKTYESFLHVFPTSVSCRLLRVRAGFCGHRRSASL